MHEEKAPECFFKDSILTLTEAESRLSLGMTSNKTYHFQSTANHHRLFCPNFFSRKKYLWLRNTLPTYDLDICPNFHRFFFISLTSYDDNTIVFISIIFRNASKESLQKKRSGDGLIGEIENKFLIWFSSFIVFWFQWYAFMGLTM